MHKWSPLLAAKMLATNFVFCTRLLSLVFPLEIWIYISMESTMNNFNHIVISVDVLATLRQCIIIRATDLTSTSRVCSQAVSRSNSIHKDVKCAVGFPNQRWAMTGSKSTVTY